MDSTVLAPEDFPWDALYRAIAPFLTRILFCLRVPEHDGQDLAQDVRLTIFRQAIQPLPPTHPLQRWLRGEPGADAHVRHWVGVIAYHVVLNYRTAAPRRRERFSPDGAMHIVAGGPSAARQLADAERLQDIVHLLDELAEEHRLVLVMYYFEGRTTEVIAAELGIPQGTVFSRMGRARAEMKAAIQRKAPHLMLAADMDPTVPDLPPFSDGDGAARSEREGAPWPELFALLLLLGVRRWATPPQQVRAEPEHRRATAAPIGQAPSGKRAIVPLVAAPLAFMSILLGGPCSSQANVARTLPRVKFPILMAVPFPQEPLRPAPSNESALRENDKLASPAPLGDSALESAAPEPAADEVPETTAFISGKAPDEDHLRPWFLPVNITWPGSSWRSSPMKPIQPATFVAPLVALCLSGGGCEPGNPTEPDPSVLAAGGAGGAGAGGAGGATVCVPGEMAPCYSGPPGTEGVGVCKPGTATCSNDGMGYGPCQNEVPPGIENCAAPADEDCNGVSPPCSGKALWSKRFDGPQGSAFGTKIAVDTGGHVITTGGFAGMVDFGNGAVASTGGQDLFIAKFDAAGNHLWSRHFGDSGNQTGTGIAVDAQGNVLVTGEFWSSIDFGHGPFASAGTTDVFVVKLDPLGNPLWSRSFGDSAVQEGLSIASDPGGNVWVTGTFSGTVDLGGNLLTSAGLEDIFLLKLSPIGDHIFSTKIGDSQSQVPHRIATDGTGHIWLAGYFGGTINLGGNSLTSMGAADVFLGKLDDGGMHLYSTRFGDAQGQYGFELALDAAGAPLLAGSFESSIDFGGGVLTSAGAKDIFISAFSASGAHRWSKRFGDASGQEASGITFDGLGNVWMVGSYYGDLDFGGGVLTSAGAKDIFLASFDPSGNPLWSQHFGDALDQVGLSIAAGADGTVLMTGRFSGSVDFGTGPLVSQSGDSTFLAKFIQ